VGAKGTLACPPTFIAARRQPDRGPETIVTNKLVQRAGEARSPGLICRLKPFEECLICWFLTVAS